MVWCNLQENPTDKGFGSRRKVVQGKVPQAASVLHVWGSVFQNTLYFSTVNTDCYQESHSEMWKNKSEDLSEVG